MNSTARNIDHHQSCRKPDQLVVFRERAEARAMLIANGYLDLQTAVDQLQESAVALGLVATHGQDAIQEILAESFARWRLE
jgi:hypothetical protein